MISISGSKKNKCKREFFNSIETIFLFGKKRKFIKQNY